MKRWETPFTFPNGLCIKNRLIFAPISTMSSNAIGQLSPEEIRFYKSRSQQTGLIILGSANVSTDGKAYQNNVSIAHDAMIPNLKNYNEQIKKSDTKSIIQLYHGGRAIGFLPSQKEISVVSKQEDDKNNFNELTEKEILTIIEDFGRAIRRAVRAGFNGIEIHAGNPFLVQEFLSPHSNTRQDLWGGNEERRYHFLEVVLKLAMEIRTETPSPFAIGVRLAVEENISDGLTFEESRRIVERISQIGVDYVHFNQENLFEKSDKIETLQKLNDSITIINNGGIMSEHTLDDALDITPLVSVARPLILNPYFPKKSKKYRSFDEISQKELMIPNGMWKSISDSPEWYLNKNIKVIAT